MKNVISILSALILLVVVQVNVVRAQQVDTEILSIVSIDEISQINNSTIEFDVRLGRNSEAWDRWANGTFQLKIEGIADDRYNDSVMSVTLIPGTTELTTQAYSKSPLTAYVITPRLFPGRISVTILGPDEYSSAKFIPRDSTIRLGRFRVELRNNGRLGSNVQWVTPIDYYQANAYKLDRDSVKQNVTWYSTDDNVEMRNFPRILMNGRTIVRKDSFRITPTSTQCFTLRDSSFIATYLGDRFVGLRWQTTCEQGIQGYIVRRRVVECLGLLPSDLEFREVRRFGTVFDTALVSKGNSRTGFSYLMNVPDTVKYRDVVYEYELSALAFDGTRRYIDTTRVRIPNAVITTATGYPNPFATRSTISYTVSDRVTLTAKVYDITGKELATLIDKVDTPRSTPNANGELTPYTIVWNAPDQASQGLYNVIFIAYPVDDNSVELSRAILKLQLLR